MPLLFGGDRCVVLMLLPTAEYCCGNYLHSLFNIICIHNGKMNYVDELEGCGAILRMPLARVKDGANWKARGEYWRWHNVGRDSSG